jgi:hypothetical protein
VTANSWQAQLCKVVRSSSAQPPKAVVSYAKSCVWSLSGALLGSMRRSSVVPLSTSPLDKRRHKCGATVLQTPVRGHMPKQHSAACSLYPKWSACRAPRLRLVAARVAWSCSTHGVPVAGIHTSVTSRSRRSALPCSPATRLAFHGSRSRGIVKPEAQLSVQSHGVCRAFLEGLRHLALDFMKVVIAFVTRGHCGYAKRLACASSLYGPGSLKINSKASLPGTRTWTDTALYSLSSMRQQLLLSSSGHHGMLSYLCKSCSRMTQPRSSWHLSWWIKIAACAVRIMYCIWYMVRSCSTVQ